MAKSDQSGEEMSGAELEEGEGKANRSSGRPSAMQAVSVRLPVSLVKDLNDEANKRGIRPSELLRIAIEALLYPPPKSDAGADLNASVGYQMTVVAPLARYYTENSNLVVEVPTEPSQVVALGYGSSKQA